MPCLSRFWLKLFWHSLYILQQMGCSSCSVHLPVLLYLRVDVIHCGLNKTTTICRWPWRLWSWLKKIYLTDACTVYPKKYAHGFCFDVLCCGYTLTDFPISIRLTSLALWQSNDCHSASRATLMNMDKYFIWIHYERLHNNNKAKHNKIVCIFLGIYCISHQDSKLCGDGGGGCWLLVGSGWWVVVGYDRRWSVVVVLDFWWVVVVCGGGTGW